MRLAGVALFLVGVASCTPATASLAEVDAYREERGRLVEGDTAFTTFRGRYAEYSVRLTSSTGVAATGRLLRPSHGEGPFPGVLLNDGRELNSEVLHYLPADFGDVVVLALDYPEELPYEVNVRTLLFRSGRMRQAARRIPLLFSLGASHLAGRSDVDSTRVAIAATSFAVPFATIAASVDERFRNVALIYGAGDMPSVVAANLGARPHFLRYPLAWLMMRPFAEFEPTRYVARIAPRPLIMVNGIDDPQMPVSAVQALYEAAHEPKTLIWLRTGHLMPTDAELIHSLVDTAFARLPVLEGSRASRPALAPSDGGEPRRSQGH